MDGILTTVRQALENYDVQEFISYLSHSTWQFLTDKECHDIERKRGKDQKWFFLMNLLKTNPERIEQFSVISQQFATNIHAEVYRALSSLSRSVLQASTNSSHNRLSQPNPRHPAEQSHSQPQTQVHKFTTKWRAGDHRDDESGSGVYVSTNLHHHDVSEDNGMMELDSEPHSQPDSVDFKPSQISPEEEISAEERVENRHHLETEDAGYGTFHTNSTNQSLEFTSSPDPSTTGYPPRIPTYPRDRVNHHLTRVAAQLHGNQSESRMKCRQFYDYDPFAIRQHHQQPQPTVQVHNHFYQFNSPDTTQLFRPALHSATHMQSIGNIEERTTNRSTSSDSDEELERLSRAKMQKKKRILEKLSKELVQSMDVPTLLPFLQKRKLVTPRDVDYLQMKDVTDVDKCMHILSQLPKKGFDFFERFVQCLKDGSEHSGHVDLVILLEKKYAKHCAVI